MHFKNLYHREKTLKEDIFKKVCEIYNNQPIETINKTEMDIGISFEAALYIRYNSIIIDTAIRSIATTYPGQLNILSSFAITVPSGAFILYRKLVPKA